MVRPIYPMDLHDFLTSFLEGNRSKIDILMGELPGLLSDWHTKKTGV